MNTHEEILEQIKKGREIAQELVELSKNTRNEAELELWSSANALVMTIDKFSSDAVKSRRKAKILLEVIEKVMTDEFLPVLMFMSIIYK